MKASRDKAIREVSLRGIEDAGELCASLNADTINATVKWFDAKASTGPGLLAWKLKEGGIYVSDDDDETPAMGTIWKEENRVAWIEKWMPEEMEKDEGFRAEIALIGCVRAGLQPSLAAVRRFMPEEESKPRPLQPVEPQRGFKRIGDAVKDVAA